MELSLLISLGVFTIAFLIGATAIGGLLLVPTLVVVGNYTVHQVIPVSLMATFFSGVIGSLVFGRKGHVSLRDVAIIALPAGLTALVGTYLLPFIPSKAVEFLIAIFCIGAFLLSFQAVEIQRPAEIDPRLSRRTLALIGAATGLGSALSGTGGPLILIPILSYIGFGSKRSVGMAQAIQLPIGGFAAFGNMTIGAIDYRLAVPITVLVIVGSLCGALYAQRLNVSALRPLISFTMLGCGIFYLVRLA
ncbi:sulfite exporter TauE/SafE family protein (plasmid) [Aquamicrobium terrae]